MKILFLNTTGGYFGGVEQNIALATKGLTERGHICFFACQKNSAVEQQSFDALFTSTWNLGTVPLDSILAQTKPEVIYVHKFDDIESVRRVSKNIPIVRMIHDHDLYCPRRHKYYALSHKICTKKAGIGCYLDLAFLERGPKGIAFTSIRNKLNDLNENRKLHTLIVGSNYMKGELLRNGFSDGQIALLPPCIAPFAEPPKEFPKENTILFVGQLIRGKGVDTLIKAFALLKNRYPFPVTLEILGTGNDLENLQTLVQEEGLTEVVKFIGWVSHDKLVSFYDNASIVVVPSRWPEPFGMVGVEAMLRQRPVVASKVGGIPDWLEDGKTGFLAPSTEAQAFADKMLILLQDKKLAREFGMAGFRKAETAFSFATYCERLETILMGGNL
ncbi:glycosyltransferase [Sphaerochaeta pleomorpha str. Grapes]|uniref:Glycosyltransferase n=1 Tax=Sphaerochaeta pleomorpha (strain ATCC BAA-1885 / DSM 22778 / Grapes) TaxID=158190 RepID=G8QSA7_SPHPG|nr:glycosyltransferase family 4 protein [Sphaerochaeta pleomorpha]AEV30037.1 glycosyltransferase [Sphaerochaeta pleomorpha str. Grapes]